MLRYKVYLVDILEMIERIVYHSEKVGINFKNLSFYDATLMRLQVIGESIKKLPKDELKKYPEVNWDMFVKFREIVSHEYFKINHKILNDIIKNKLPVLRSAVKDMNRKLK